MHVEDLGEGSVAAINKKLINQTVTFKSSKNIKIKNLAKKIIQLTGSKSKIIFNKKKRTFRWFYLKYIKY